MASCILSLTVVDIIAGVCFAAFGGMVNVLGGLLRARQGETAETCSVGCHVASRRRM